MDGLEQNELLRPAYITKVLDSIYPDPSQYALTNEVPVVTQEGEMVVVDVRHQMGGMTQAVAEGAESPIIEQRGRAQWSFQPAHFREKVLLSEKDVKAIRRLGTASEVETAQQKMTEILGDLRMRVETRIEWAKWAMVYGTLSVAQEDVQFSIDYKIPSEFTPTLTGADLWSAATSDPVSDMVDWLEVYRDEGTVPEYFQYNLKVEKELLMNEKIRDLRDSLFVGQANMGNLTRKNLSVVLNAYAGMEGRVYDKGYYFTFKITSAITNISTTFTVNENPGIAIGDTIVVQQKGEPLTRVKIAVTNVSGTTITHAAIGGSTTFAVGSWGRAKKHFISDASFIIRGSVPPGTMGGTNWAEFISTNHVYGPGGIMSPQPGIFAKTIIKSDDDPPRIEVIAGVSGLPVLYHPTVNLVASVL